MSKHRRKNGFLSRPRSPREGAEETTESYGVRVLDPAGDADLGDDTETAETAGAALAGAADAADVADEPTQVLAVPAPADAVTDAVTAGEAVHHVDVTDTARPVIALPTPLQLSNDDTQPLPAVAARPYVETGYAPVPHPSPQLLPDGVRPPASLIPSAPYTSAPPPTQPPPAFVPPADVPAEPVAEPAAYMPVVQPTAPEAPEPTPHQPPAAPAAPPVAAQTAFAPPVDPTTYGAPPVDPTTYGAPPPVIPAQHTAYAPPTESYDVPAVVPDVIAGTVPPLVPDGVVPGVVPDGPPLQPQQLAPAAVVAPVAPPVLPTVDQVAAPAAEPVEQPSDPAVAQLTVAGSAVAGPAVTEPAVAGPALAEPVVVEPPVVEPLAEPAVAEPPADGDDASAPGAAVVHAVIAPGRQLRHAEERTARRRRTLLVAAAAVIALVLGTLVVLTGGGRGGAGNGTAGGPTTPAKTSLLMLVGPGNTMQGGALIGHGGDSERVNVVLLPSRVITTIPGRGALPLGRATEFDRSALPAATVGDLLGVRVDSTWIVNRRTFADLIDASGGVVVDVDTDVRDTRGGQTLIVTRAGSAVPLTGTQAAAYASYLADGEQETARLVRFQRVLDALVAKLPETGDATGNRLAALGGDSVVTGEAAAVGAALVALREASSASEVSYVPLPVRLIDSGSDELLYGVELDEIRSLVQERFSGSVLQLRAGSGNRVYVENGVGTPGLGEDVRNQLVAAGFQFVGSNNVPGFTMRDKPSRVLIFDSSVAAQEAGRDVAEALCLPPTSVALSRQAQPIADVVVMIGNDYGC